MDTILNRTKFLSVPLNNGQRIKNSKFNIFGFRFGPPQYCIFGAFYYATNNHNPKSYFIDHMNNNCLLGEVSSEYLRALSLVNRDPIFLILKHSEQRLMNCKSLEAREAIRTDCLNKLIAAGVKIEEELQPTKSFIKEFALL